MCESVFASDTLAVNTSRVAHIGTLWFETVIVGTEWDPALFTKILNDCRERYKNWRSTSPAFSHMHTENTVLSLLLQDKWPLKVFWRSLPGPICFGATRNQQKNHRPKYFISFGILFYFFPILWVTAILAKCNGRFLQRWFCSVTSPCIFEVIHWSHPSP